MLILFWHDHMYHDMVLQQSEWLLVWPDTHAFLRPPPPVVSIITTLKSMTVPWLFFCLRGAYGQYSTIDGTYGQDSVGKGTGSGAKIIAGLGSHDVKSAPLDSVICPLECNALQSERRESLVITPIVMLVLWVDACTKQAPGSPNCTNSSMVAI